MQTLIVQSYRTHDVAPWISACLETVRNWTAESGHAYEFVDDRLFDYAPAWARELCGSRILPVTDLARLYLLRDYLQRSWKRVVWIDADVLVFDPAGFVLEEDAAYSLCREVMVQAVPGQGVQTGEAINNAVLLMTKDQPVLDFLIFAVEEILRARPPHEISSLTVGTRFFTALARAMPVRVLQSVGLFTPPLIRDILAGGGALLDAWAKRFARPIGAANLCASMQDRQVAGLQVSADDMKQTVDILLGTRGAVVNQRIRA